MEQRRLGKTNINVSVICLGTMTYGEQNTEAQAFEQMDYAVANSVNIFDTAEMYAVPPRKETYGETERIIGNWIASRKSRDKVILATKVAGPRNLAYVRDGEPRLNRWHIEQAINESLKRLQTDYIDLYQVHWPERPANYFGKLGYTYADNDESLVPIEETLNALADCVSSGKIRHIGVSNETPWGIAEYLRLAKERGWPEIVSVQNPYNLLNRAFEVGLAEFAQREAVGLLAYSPLAFGTLAGKYLNEQWPDGARLTLFKQFDRYFKPNGVRATQDYVALAKDHGLSPTQMALAYVNSRPFLTSNIIGATTMEQLKENIESAHVTLSEEVVAAIETIHADNPNPCP